MEEPNTRSTLSRTPEDAAVTLTRQVIREYANQLALMVKQDTGHTPGEVEWFGAVVEAMIDIHDGIGRVLP